MQAGEKDVLGNQAGPQYSVILTDLNFENRLKMFDPNLCLRFHRLWKCWVVLERALDNTGYNVLIKCQDNEGNPKALGDWVFNRLFVMRHNNEEKMRNFDTWMRSVDNEIEYIERKKDEKISEDVSLQILDDINLWRRVNREMNGLPLSDVTAGYRKVEARKRKMNECRIYS